MNQEAYVILDSVKQIHIYNELCYIPKSFIINKNSLHKIRQSDIIIKRINHSVRIYCMNCMYYETYNTESLAMKKSSAIVS